MGQKVSPIGMRVGVIRDWESRWYAEKADFGDLLNEDVKIREFIEKKLKDAYVSRVEIERTGKKDCKIVIRCARPGAAAGKDDKGKDKMDALKKELIKLTGNKSVKVDVVAVANPDLDAHLVARKICEQLEARQSLPRRRQSSRQCVLAQRVSRPCRPADSAAQKSHVRKDTLRVSFLCTHCVPISTMPVMKLTPHTVRSA